MSMINYRRTTKSALVPERRRTHERQKTHRLQRHVLKHWRTARLHLLYLGRCHDADELRQRKTHSSSHGHPTLERMDLTT